jgi:hypothetical protein
MVPVPTQESKDRLPPHRKPTQVEDEVHEIHTEMKKKKLKNMFDKFSLQSEC